MTEFQWVPRNYRIDSGATRNRTFKFFISKVLINSTNFYLVKIKTIELAIFLISIISIFIAVIFLTVQRYGKGSIPPNSMEINFPKTSVFTPFLMIFPLLLVSY